MSLRRSTRKKADTKMDIPQQIENEDSEEPPKKKSKTSKKVKSLQSQETTKNTDFEDWEKAVSIHEFTAKDINGEQVSLEKYKGHVCIIVNVASKCGHTKSNYEQLVDLFEKYGKEKGLKILAFPCNQFGGQEPGDSQKICDFTKKRNVKFDIFEKINVNGQNAHPLWKFMTKKIGGPKGSKIDWNFTKFIIDKNGQVIERHKPSMKPLQLVASLEKLW